MISLIRINKLRLICSLYKFTISHKLLLLSVILYGIFFSGNAQKKGGNASKDIIVRVCTQNIGNGLYSASFGYENPSNKEVLINEDSSIIRYNNGKKVAKGLNKFKSGSVSKAFTKQFSANETVEWTVINPSGKVHTVYASANSSHCTDIESSFIFPVYSQGNGKENLLIGSKLTALAEGTAGDIPSPLIFQINKDRVIIEIVPNEGHMQAVINLLTMTYGLGYDSINSANSDFLLDPSVYSSLSAVDVYFPINKLLELNTYNNDINFVRPLYPPIKNSIGDGYTGESVSQGDEIQTSKVVREAFRLIINDEILPVDGSGVKIGAISNSYDTQPFTNGISKATTDVKNGDLPGLLNTHGYNQDVDVRKEWPYGETTDEGRAMLHIIHDIAPGASLVFHTGTISPRNFEVGFRDLFDCDIIVDDITFITEPFFGDGRISVAIKDYTAQGKMHFTSAGNFGNDGYQGNFNSTSTVPTTNFINENLTTAHKFDEVTGDYLQKISVKGGETYMLVLQWKDLTSASQDNAVGSLADLDFYIVDDLGRLLVGNNRSNERGDAAEIMVFSASSDGEANLLITSANGAVDVPFRYIAFKSSGLTLLEYNDGAPTISGHAMTKESIRVGAIRFNKTEPESFSSYGGALSDGTTVIPVDFSAPEGVNTNVGSIGQKFYKDGTPIDGDIFPNFFGTSASAPSAAAGVALLQSVLPTWYSDGNGGSTKSSEDVIQLFKNNSIASSKPLQAGAGMINVNSVFKSLAAQTARITSIVIEEGKTPSAEPFTVTIIGDFFPSPTADPYPAKVYFDDVEMDYIVNDDGSISATIPAFVGNPDLKIFTSPKEGTVGNGGFSEPVKVLPEGIIALNINVKDVEIKYGQDYKSKMSYTVEGIPVEGFPENKTFEEYFPPIVFSSTGDDFNYPDVNNYVITASFGLEVLTQEQREKYQINFIKNGNLVVNKNNLTITPQNTEEIYGRDINIVLEYGGYGTINSDGAYTLDSIYNPDDFLFAIKAAHQSDFYVEDDKTPVLLINNFNNQNARYQDILNLLATGSWISSENSVVNRVSELPNRYSGLGNGRVAGLANFINLDVENFTEYIDNYLTNGRVAALANGRVAALANGYDLLNGRVAALANGRVAALANGTNFGVGNDSNDYSSVFSVIDIEDVPENCGGQNQEPCSISKFYALNLITGVEVTNGVPHLIFPGTFLKSMSDNFNITYKSANLVVSPESLIANTTSLELEYGDEIGPLLSTEIIDWVYEDTIEDVLPDGIPYYFINENGEELEMDEVKELGNYTIKIRDFKNYRITNTNDNNFGSLTIKAKELTPETAPSLDSTYFEAEFGTFNASDLTTEFGISPEGFAYGELVTDVFGNDGIPYTFIKEGGDGTIYGKTDRLGVGVYEIKISSTTNYGINGYGANHSKLKITAAPLTVKTTAFDIEYGETATITNLGISGWKFNDATEVTVHYYFEDGALHTYELGEKMDINIYQIRVSSIDNYTIAYDGGHGNLTVIQKELFPETAYHEAVYGAFDSSDLITQFGLSPEGFAYGELEADVYSTNGIPYTFVRDGMVYSKTDKLEVGDYEIEFEGADNYVINSYGGAHSFLRITPAQLNVTISPTNLILNQGDIPQITTSITGYISGETETSVFHDGVSYYFEDESGNSLSNTDFAGVYTIKINDPDPKNYAITYENDAKLFINSTLDSKNVRTYSDCVAYNPYANDGLIYTVTFRYENDNDNPVYVNASDNILTGPAALSSSGELPTVLLPGSGTFEIRFNGNKLVWSLTTFGQAHKSSVSSASTSESGECDAKLDGAYSVYPNPVKNFLYIKQNVAEASNVYVLNMYGASVINERRFDGSTDIITIDMSGLGNGLYIVRIVSATTMRTYNIIKEE